MSIAEATAATFAPAQDRAAPALRIGDVIGQARRLFVARWATYSGLVAIAYAPLLAEVTLTVRSGPGVTIGFSAPLLATIATCVWLTLSNGAIFLAVSQECAGRRLTIAQFVPGALRRLPALVGLFLLISICLLLGAILLLIPALIVLCIYAVAAPACAVEGLGPIRSMARSAFLTKGNRWRIFGLVLLLYVGLALISEPIAFLARHFGGRLAGIIVTMPVEGVAGGFSAVAIGVLYAQLRAAREGVAGERIAGVFD
jgi:hypothetical protein